MRQLNSAPRFHIESFDLMTTTLINSCFLCNNSFQLFACSHSNMVNLPCLSKIDLADVCGSVHTASSQFESVRWAKSPVEQYWFPREERNQTILDFSYLLLL